MPIACSVGRVYNNCRPFLEDIAYLRESKEQMRLCGVSQMNDDGTGGSEGERTNQEWLPSG